MPRSVSVAFRTAIEAQYSNVPVLLLLKLEHERLATPIYLANNTEDVVSNGITYVGFPFELTRPGEEEESGQSLGKIAVQNVDRAIGAAVLELDGPITFTLQVVTNDDPDDVEFELQHLVLRNVSGDAMTLQADIGIRYDLSTVPFPGIRATKARTPGLWR